MLSYQDRILVPRQFPVSRRAGKESLPRLLCIPCRVPQQVPRSTSHVLEGRSIPGSKASAPNPHPRIHRHAQWSHLMESTDRGHSQHANTSSCCSRMVPASWNRDLRSPQGVSLTDQNTEASRHRDATTDSSETLNTSRELDQPHTTSQLQWTQQPQGER